MSPDPAQPLLQSSFPRAVLHVDGDAFFTSVEQAVHPELKGRPVVTGQERGIIACASYEAKALGIRRGVALWEARKLCPQLVVLPSDYELYSLFSKRLFEIMRRYTPLVEEHSIDEGFADISGLRRVFRASYQDIALQIQETVRGELDIGVSIGLSLSKSLAKLASKFRKPHGFTPVAGRHLHRFLPRIALADVWGFGPNTVHLLQQQGLRTAWDFVQRPEAWAGQRLGKVGRETWQELRGQSMWPVNPEEKTSYATVSKCKTFTAPSADRAYVYARLIRNLENACIKLRRHRLAARTLVVGLRRKDYTESAVEARLSRPTALTQELLPLARELFDAIHVDGAVYRSTLVVLGKLQEDRHRQYELFEDPVRVEALARLARAVDAVNERFGKHKLQPGATLYAPARPANARDEEPWRHRARLPGETRRKRLYLPMLAIKV